MSNTAAVKAIKVGELLVIKINNKVPSIYCFVGSDYYIKVTRVYCIAQILVGLIFGR